MPTSGIVPSTQNAQEERPFPVSTRWLSARNLLLLMTLLELGWLAVIWVMRATDATHKLLPLLISTLLLGTAAVLLPDRSFTWLPLDNERIGRGETGLLLLFGLFIGAVLVFFASQQRVWAFDEEGNLRAAVAVANNGIASLFENYDRRPWLGKQHPPLVPIMYGLAMKVLGTSQLAGRLITAVFALGNGWRTYCIGRRLFYRQTALLGALLLFSFPLVFRLGAAAMVETPLTFFFTLAVLLTLRLVERPSLGRLMWVGAAIGAGLLSKYTMVFVFPLVFGIIAVRGTVTQAVRYFGAMFFVGALLFAGWLLYANQLDVIQAQFATIWEYAGLVLTNDYGRRILFESMTSRLPSGLGVYNLPLLALGIILMARRRCKTSCP